METITDADYTDDLDLLVNTPVQAKSLLHSLNQAASDIGLYVLKQVGINFTLNGRPLK